jgi:hypothetical protein
MLSLSTTSAKVGRAFSFASVCVLSALRGAPFLDADDSENVKLLFGKIAHSNEKLLRSLASVGHEIELERQASLDAEMGRMSRLVEIAHKSVNDTLLAPRFGVPEQRPDGRRKIRPIDHFSWSNEGLGSKQQKLHSVNGAFTSDANSRHNTLDDLALSLTRFHEAFKTEPGLFKADIDSAFRRIPILPSHRWASGITMRVGCKVSFHGQDPRCVVAVFRLSDLHGNALRMPIRGSV